MTSNTSRIFSTRLDVQVFTKGVDKEMVCLLAARASRIENQDAIDAAIVGVLADPKEVWIREYFLERFLLNEMLQKIKTMELLVKYNCWFEGFF